MTDLTGTVCKCGCGTLTEHSVHDDMDGMLSCSSCGRRSPRHINKGMENKPHNLAAAIRQVMTQTISESADKPLAEDYIESMGDDFDTGIDKIVAAWTKWKKGPMTEREDIAPAKAEILSYLKGKLK